jgi:hypothetical protein
VTYYYDIFGECQCENQSSCPAFRATIRTLFPVAIIYYLLF